MGKNGNGGIYIHREVYQSPAFMSLKGFAPKLLLLFLDKRIRKKQKNSKDRKGSKREPEYINLENITMAYSEIEKRYSVPRQTVVRAIDELLAKGFIEIRHHGGTMKHDMTVYAIVEKWRLWSPTSQPFSKRPRDVKRGYQGQHNGNLKNSRA